MDFSALCTEHIIAHYFYATVGNYRLIIDKDKNMFNATKFCLIENKHFRNWKKNKKTQLLLQEYQSANLQDPVLICVRGNSSPIYNTVISGTYLKMHFLLDVANWVSRQCFLNISESLKNLFPGDTIRRETEELNRQLEERNQENQDLQAQNSGLRQENERFKKVEEDISPKTSIVSKRHEFLLIDKGTPEEEFPYCSVRTQKKRKCHRLDELRSEYPNFTVLLELEYNPNPITMFNLAKERFPKIKCRYNDIKLLEDYTINEFIEDLVRLSKTKFNAEVVAENAATGSF